MYTTVIMNGMTAQRQATSIKLLEGAVVRHHSEEWIRKAERNKEMYRVKRIVVLLLSFLLQAVWRKKPGSIFIARQALGGPAHL